MSTAKIALRNGLLSVKTMSRGIRALTAVGRSPAAHNWCQATAGPAGPGVSAWNAQTGVVAVRSAQQCPDRARADVTGRDFMSAEADGTAPAAESSGLSGLSGSASALARLENWHHDVVTQVDGWGWIRTLNDQLTAVLAPWRERYQGNPVLELMHGGRWLGHPLHPALSDLPIGLWAGALILDVAGGDPAGGAGGQENGMDPVALFTAAGVVAAVATAATGIVDWTVSDD